MTKRRKIKPLFWLACAAFLGSARAEAFDDNAIVTKNVREMSRHYEQALRGPSFDASTGGDLEIQCLNNVFFHSAGAYLFSIQQAKYIDPAAIKEPLDHFAKLWFQSEDQLKIMDFYRPGAKEVVRQALGAALLEQAESLGINLGLHGDTWVSLGNYGEKFFTAMLKLCSSDTFKKNVIGKLPEPDYTISVPPGLTRSPHGQVEWGRDDKWGGFKPIWKTN